MASANVRPLLHTVHLVLFAVLLGTGALLLAPNLRAAVTGGYSLLIRDTHRWGGAAFVLFPAAILWRAGARGLLASPRPRTVRSLWQAFHLAATVMASTLLALTGFALWGKRGLPESAAQLALDGHDWLTYAVAALLALHLVEIGAAALISAHSVTQSSNGHPLPTREDQTCNARR